MPEQSLEKALRHEEVWWNTDPDCVKSQTDKTPRAVKRNREALPVSSGVGQEARLAAQRLWNFPDQVHPFYHPEMSLQPPKEQLLKQNKQTKGSPQRKEQLLELLPIHSPFLNSNLNHFSTDRISSLKPPFEGPTRDLAHFLV